MNGVSEINISTSASIMTTKERAAAFDKKMASRRSSDPEYKAVRRDSAPASLAGVLLCGMLEFVSVDLPKRTKQVVSDALDVVPAKVRSGSAKRHGFEKLR